MFTGIIESTGIVKKLTGKNSNLQMTISAPFAAELRADESVSHNGVCLTVTKAGKKDYDVTVIKETLSRTNLGELKVNDVINLERSLRANGRFDGHIVQGHVDGTAECTAIEPQKGSRLYTFRLHKKHGGLLVEKGSVCINGVSLTVVSASSTGFTVAIIPYTLSHTNFKTLRPGHKVNIEYDIVGKYIRSLVLKQK